MPAISIGLYCPENGNMREAGFWPVGTEVVAAAQVGLSSFLSAVLTPESAVISVRPAFPVEGDQLIILVDHTPETAEQVRELVRIAVAEWLQRH